MANATITVPVTGFANLGTGICPNGTLTIDCNPPNRVTLNTAFNTLVVTNPGGHGNGRIKMDFVVVSTENPPKDYAVCGFIITNGGLSNPTLGHGNFSNDQINGNVLSLTNHYTKGRTSWKLFIAIQYMDAGGVGRVGVVDPGIENSDAD